MEMMPLTLRQLGLFLLLAFVGGGRLFASQTATLRVGGQPSSSTDSGTITVAFNGFTETIPYGPFSTTGSLASDLAATFTRDFVQFGLYAMAGAPSQPNPSIVTFLLANGQSFTGLDSSLSSNSFGLYGTGFGAPPVGTPDTGIGVLSLSINGTGVSVQVPYTEGSTATSIAQALAAGLPSGIGVSADYRAGGFLDLTSTSTGSATNYGYGLHFTDSTGNASPFSASPASGNLAGGAAAVTGSQPAGIYSYTVGYDPVGNVSSMSDGGFQGPVMGAWGYTYDSLNRLETGSTSAGPFLSTTPSICWSYDSFGNRTGQVFSGSPSCASGLAGSSTATYNSANQVSFLSTASSAILCPGGSIGMGVCYDASGNVVADATNAYLYDAEGRICAVHGPLGLTGYLYDADGNRVGKGTLTSLSCDVTVNGYQPTSDYILDLDGHQQTELASSGGGLTWVHTNVMADGALVATYDLAGLHFYFNDPLGTRRAQTDGAGNWEQNCQSLPFGDQLSCSISTSAPTEHHFTGKERDAESGLDYFGARYYASNMGRWMSPDWSEKVEPVPYAKLDDPQSLNLYEYVSNNPLNQVDADGHCPWCAVIGAVGAITAEIIADKLTKTPITVRGIVGAGVGGAIIGGSVGLATGEALLIQAAIVGSGSVVGGVAERTIKTGSIDKATDSPKEMLKDAAIGAAGHIANKSAEVGVGKVAGGAVRKLGSQVERAKSMTRLAKVGGRLEAASKSLEQKQTIVSTGTDTARDTAVRSNSNNNEKEQKNEK
jgi:RHS repeat-associated protein